MSWRTFDTYSSVAISIHELAKRCMTFDLELYHGVILSQDLQVDVLTFSTLFVLQHERIRQGEKQSLGDITLKAVSLIHMQTAHTNTKRLRVYEEFSSCTQHPDGAPFWGDVLRSMRNEKS